MTETAPFVTAETCKPVDVLTDAHVRVTLSVPSANYAYYSLERMQQYARDLEGAAQDFYEFVRDHRHQDCTGVDVVREYTKHCSLCNKPWEPYFNDEKKRLECAHCTAEVVP